MALKILGLTSPISFNSAAATLVDGRLVAAVEEERYVHIKHAPRMLPLSAARYCLDVAETTLRDVDYIAIGHERPGRHLLELGRETLLGRLGASPHRFEQEAGFLSAHYFGVRNLFGRMVPDKKRSRFVEHHLSHAASAFFCSPFERAAILTIDGRGGFSSGLLAVGEGATIRELVRIPVGQSLGLFYERATEALGFRKHSEEGKVMGLAAYAQGPDTQPFDFIVTPKGAPPCIDEAGCDAFFRSLRYRDPGSELTDEHRLLAARTQKSLEAMGHAWVDYLLEKTGAKNLCLAGGVALNCSMNGTLARRGDVDGIFVQPASSDSGTALGAALFVHAAETGKRPDFVMEHACWGPEYGDAEIADAISKSKVAHWKKCDDISAAAAEKLAAGKIVAWFQGRCELGPRALGARSILANPGLPEMKDKVNKEVKWREPWRPFAPSIQEEKVAQFVHDPIISPFMIVAFNANEYGRKTIPAAVHVDGTCRVQSVSRKAQPLYWHLLEEMEKRTGAAVVMNTSFNVKGQPIVLSPLEAISTFYSCGLDHLAIGSYLISKSEES